MSSAERRIETERLLLRRWLGRRLPRALWDAGDATEAAIASRDDVFQVTGYDRLIRPLHPGNIASQRIMEKLGMRRVEYVDDPTIGVVLRRRLDRAAGKAA